MLELSINRKLSILCRTYWACYSIASGVRQGGMQSPTIFALHMHRLSRALTLTLTLCCYTNVQPINNFMYAESANHQVTLNLIV